MLIVNLQKKLTNFKILKQFCEIYDYPKIFLCVHLLFKILQKIQSIVTQAFRQR